MPSRMALKNNVRKAKMQFPNSSSAIYNVSQSQKNNFFLASSSLLYTNIFNLNKSRKGQNGGTICTKFEIEY